MKLSLAILGLVAAALANPSHKDQAKAIAEQLSIRVGVETNFPNTPKQTVDCSALGADWNLCGVQYLKINNSGQPIVAKNWSMYFHSIRRVLDIHNEGFKLEFITGDLYKITPSDKFKEIPAGELKINLVFEYWIIFNTDFIPSYWIEINDDPKSGVTIENTKVVTEDVTSFVDTISGDDWIRVPDAAVPQANLATRFDKQKAEVVQDVSAEIVPKPLKVVATNEHADLSKGVHIVANGLRNGALEAVWERLESFGIKKNASGYKINVSVSKTNLPADAAKHEGYHMKVEADSATIVGYNGAGAFYGLQSFASLFKIGETTVPTVEVVDAPYLKERRQHIDVARNFHQMEFIKKAIDQMGAYKINMFHFHLTDDEGWRIEIPGLPELTEIGGKRCRSENESECLMPLLGSGPGTDNHGSGHFTVDQYKEIVKYAHSRYIEVFPEIDMPGHGRAAIISMEGRYHKYAAQGDMKKAEEYRLMDPEDTSKFLSIQFYDKAAQINSCMPGAVKFVEKLVKEIATMHKDAGVPLKSWHFGADEVHNILLGGGFVNKSLPDAEKVGKGQIDYTGLTQPFELSPVCQKFIKEHNMKGVEELIPFLAGKVASAAVKNGLTNFFAWQDGMKTTPASLLPTKGKTLNFWETMFWGGASNWPVFASLGYKLVMSCPDYTYFDFPYENNVLESGYYWAGRDQSTYNLFSFAPLNLAQNAETNLDRDGHGFTATSPELPAGVTAENTIIGISGQLWSEIVRTDELAEYMMFPRFLALAERGWHKASWELNTVAGREFSQTSNFVNKAALSEDWVRFANALGQKEAPKLLAAGINMRASVPGAAIVDGKLHLNSDMPGMTLFVSTDGKKFDAYTEPIKAKKGTKYHICGGYGEHRSRVETITA